jgi:hypothetical protein
MGEKNGYPGKCILLSGFWIGDNLMMDEYGKGNKTFQIITIQDFKQFVNF